MNGQEIKTTLRKTEFPASSKEALNKIAQLICGRVPSIKSMDLALDLITEFVFREVSRGRTTKPTHTQHTQELQLLDIMLEFFNTPGSESSKNTVFLSLFSGTTIHLRLGFLTKLVSIAVLILSPTILKSTSTWMQQLGNTSINSCKLAEALIHDFNLVPSSCFNKLDVIPDLSPQFIANFLTACGEIYYNEYRAKDGVMLFPPSYLLESITRWVTNNRQLCLSAQQTQSSLPPGAIAMEATTPLAGLFKWCILAPVCHRNNAVYCQLHLALLCTLLEIPASASPKAISAQAMSGSVGFLKGVMDRRVEGDVSLGLELEMSCDRLAQAVQVALSVNCIYGNVEELFNQLEKVMAESRLMRIVVSERKLKKL